jgi:RNA-directed DNA polymerase
MHENQETSPAAAATQSGSGSGQTTKLSMHAGEESESAVVPLKEPNEGKPEEALEGRAGAKENRHQSHTDSTQSEAAVSPGLAAVRQRARERRTEKFTNLLHHVTIELLRTSFYALQRKSAAGVDGVTWEEYETGLLGRIADLHGRVHRGAYRAQPSRRIYLPKPDGRQRPIGIAALEDKIVQQAVVTILNEIYEVDFRGFSYGFRPGRGAHQALDALAVGIERRCVNWILDADIQGFFDTLSHEWLVRFLEHRVTDSRILRLVRKWLKAGVSEDGAWSESELGTPQGAVISPLLANVYLHYVFDLWAEAWRSKTANGEMIFVRYADDLVVGFERKADAERFLREFQERLAKFGLETHPEKTRLLEFGRYARERREKRGEGEPETFAFLGFTHQCAVRQTGGFKLKRTTVRKRMEAKLQEVKRSLRARMHDAVAATGHWLGQVLNGYYRYHAIPGNQAALQRFRERIQQHWRRSLRRRSQGAAPNEAKLARLFARWLPRPRILHPYPQVRFDARYPR